MFTGTAQCSYSLALGCKLKQTDDHQSDNNYKQIEFLGFSWNKNESLNLLYTTCTELGSRGVGWVWEFGKVRYGSLGR